MKELKDKNHALEVLLDSNVKVSKGFKDYLLNASGNVHIKNLELFRDALYVLDEKDLVKNIEDLPKIYRKLNLIFDAIDHLREELTTKNGVIPQLLQDICKGGRQSGMKGLYGLVCKEDVNDDNSIITAAIYERIDNAFGVHDNKEAVSTSAQDKLSVDLKEKLEKDNEEYYKSPGKLEGSRASFKGYGRF